MVRRTRFVIKGQVQGVGFRPFVFTLAEEHRLTGFVRNSPRGVVVEIQGADAAVEAFACDLEKRLPPLARITDLSREDLSAVAAETAFSIAQSSEGSTHAVLISPDICTCPDCQADTAKPENRRFGYPFTNCTNCGPRYTITRSIPYDRRATSMACFPMCPECLAEYENPRNRRFHAQPNACPVCGPAVWFMESASGDRTGKLSGQLPKGDADSFLYNDAAMRALAAFLLRSGIAAIKGLGGFHLACDACDDKALSCLRERKNRPHKPFAVMAADLDEARRFALVGENEARLLLSPEHPIVLCPLLPAGTGSASRLSPFVSPDTASVGVMLPYTPLHFVLFAHIRKLLQQAAPENGVRLAALVMTSGNPGGEPICLGNREARAHLGPMADAFLFHNRDILIRVDDSVVRPLPEIGPLVYRRARGYVPRPVTLGASGGEAAAPCVLGVGAELKNSLCLTKDGDAFISQHIGDMANLETASFHAEMREHLADLLRVSPDLVVRDLHPDFLSSRMAEDLGAERGLPVLPLQHHAAHAYAVLAENNFEGRALVLALDGTGLGDDGTLWGGEALLMDTGPGGPSHRRLAHCASMDLPGGDAAIREPWRIAHALLLRLNLLSAEGSSLPWLPQYQQVADNLPIMLERRVNTPVSTSCGRLFDAVAALLGLCTTTTYEGQAAIRLEEAQGLNPGMHPECGGEVYPCPVNAQQESDVLVLDSHALFAAVHGDKQAGTELSLLARRFHYSLAVGFAELSALLAKRHGVRHVGLSGGCLQNVTLALLLDRLLRERGLLPLRHKELPPGDGCISLGQAAWGRLLCLRGKA